MRYDNYSYMAKEELLKDSLHLKKLSTKKNNFFAGKPQF